AGRGPRPAGAAVPGVRRGSDRSRVFRMTRREDRAMRLLGVVAVLGLAATAAADDPKAGGKATVTVVGKFTADKDSTLNYTLKRGGKVVAEGKGVSELPGKGVEVDAAGAEGPYELSLSATGGVVKVTEIGVTAA